MNIDSREFAEFYEVHYWLGLGRILVTHRSSATGFKTVLMDVSVNQVTESSRDDATSILAQLIGEAGQGMGAVREHARDGRVIDIVGPGIIYQA